MIGVFLIAYGTISSIGPINVWSDFKAFSAKVASDKQGAHVLRYGGEKNGTDFEYLLKKVWDLGKPWTQIIHLGIILSISSLAGITFHLRRERNTSKTGTNDVQEQY